MNHGSYLPPKQDAEVLLKEDVPSTLNYADYNVQLTTRHCRQRMFSFMTELIFYRWCEAFKSLRSTMYMMCPEANMWTFDDTTQAFHVFQGEIPLYQAKRTLRVRSANEQSAHSSPYAFIWDMSEPSITYQDITPPRGEIEVGDMRPPSFYWHDIDHILPDS